MNLTSMIGSRCHAIGPRYKSSDYLSLARYRKYIMITIIMLISHGIYMSSNWRPDETILGIRCGLGWVIRARL
jgi:hypothetical protein